MTADTWPADIVDLLTAAGLDPADVARVVDLTLDEDLALGDDVTSRASLPAEATGTVDIVARAPGCLAGVPVAAAVALTLAQRQGVSVGVRLVADDGARVVAGQTVLTAAGPLACLLTAERSMLNLLGQLSGVATLTAAWADELAAHPAPDGTTARVRDTRKTVPGLRALQKYAVRCGGGVNHRMALGDAALIKDNHVAAAGGVKAAFDAVRAYAPGLDIEVECDTLTQVREAVDAGVELVLLDNMTPELLREAVALCKPRGVRTEASGGLTLAVAADVAATGVDYVSVGALTHSAPVLDLGCDLRTDEAGTGVV